MNTPNTKTKQTNTKKQPSRQNIERVNATKVAFADAIERLKDCAKWVARVHLYRKCNDVTAKSGKMASGATRKTIESNGYVDMPIPNEREIEEQIVNLLRGGFEVRLFHGSVRIFHRFNDDGKLTLTAQMLKDSPLVKAMKGVKFQCFRGDESVDIGFLKKFAEEERERAKEAAKDYVCVTPDLTLRCWKCGALNRVGQKHGDVTKVEIID